MLRVGLTGGIGSGKSTVSDKFNSLFNIPVIDADEINHALLLPDSPAYQEIIDAFGNDVILSSGEINRKYLREKIFSNSNAKKKLETILHPKIRAEISNLLSCLNSEYCLIVIPLLIESQLQSMVDRILVVDTDSEHQILRVSQRDQYDHDHVKKIIQTQANPEERLMHADDIISNKGDIADLDKQIEKLHKKYLSLSQ